jgi:hypothetical protein
MPPEFPDSQQAPPAQNSLPDATPTPQHDLVQRVRQIQKKASVRAESQLLSDVEALREKNLTTRDLYREVCRLLFFKYGEHPTTTRLYELVRKGSNSVPGEELRKFWEEVRNDAVSRLSMPRVPDALQSSVETFVVQLWEAAQKSADESLERFYKTAQASIDEANARAEAEASKNERLCDEVMSLKNLLEIQKDHSSSLESDLAERTKECVKLRADLSAANAELVSANRLAAEINEQRRADAVEAAQSLRSAEGRFRESEKRLYMEVDRERERTKVAEAALQKQREEGAKAEAAHRNESSALYREIGDLKQNAGAAEAKLNAAEQRNRELEVQIRQLSDEVRTTTAEAAEMRAELDATRTDLKATQTRLDHTVADNMDLKALNSKLEAKIKELGSKLANDGSS